jgi:hypothetical protein
MLLCRRASNNRQVAVAVVLESAAVAVVLESATPASPLPAFVGPFLEPVGRLPPALPPGPSVSLTHEAPAADGRVTYIGPSARSRTEWSSQSRRPGARAPWSGSAPLAYSRRGPPPVQHVGVPDTSSPLVGAAPAKDRVAPGIEEDLGDHSADRNGGTDPETSKEDAMERAITRTIRTPFLALTLALAMMVAFAIPATAQPDRSSTLTDQLQEQLAAAVEDGVVDEFDGATFDGDIDITDVATSEDGDALTFSGTIVGDVLDAEGNVLRSIDDTFSFDAVPTQDGNGENGQGSGGCQILFLDLGPLFLDVLGLQVDLSQIELDITAVPGPGNLLGNLLCAVAGLLDGPGGGLGGAIGNLLDRISGILDGLLC